MNRERLQTSAVGALGVGAINTVSLGLYALLVAPWFATGYATDATVGMFLPALWGFCTLTANVYAGLTIVEQAWLRTIETTLPW